MDKQSKRISTETIKFLNDIYEKLSLLHCTRCDIRYFNYENEDEVIDANIDKIFELLQEMYEKSIIKKSRVKSGPDIDFVKNKEKKNSIVVEELDIEEDESNILETIIYSSDEDSESDEEVVEEGWRVVEEAGEISPWTTEPKTPEQLDKQDRLDRLELEAMYDKYGDGSCRNRDADEAEAQRDADEAEAQRDADEAEAQKRLQQIEKDGKDYLRMCGGDRRGWRDYDEAKSQRGDRLENEWTRTGDMYEKKDQYNKKGHKLYDEKGNHLYGKGQARKNDQYDKEGRKLYDEQGNHLYDKGGRHRYSNVNDLLHSKAWWDGYENGQMY